VGFLLFWLFLGLLQPEARLSDPVRHLGVFFLIVVFLFQL